MHQSNNLQEFCPDCAVGIGEQHKPGCDIERCPACGYQLLSCDCLDKRLARVSWTGEFPGCVECREYGLYAKLIPGRGWIPCDKDDPEATEDLNRLYEQGTWDVTLQRFVLL